MFIYVAVCNLSQCACLEASVRGLFMHVAVCTVCVHVFVIKPVFVIYVAVCTVCVHVLILKPMFVMRSCMLLFALFVTKCLSQSQPG